MYESLRKLARKIIPLPAEEISSRLNKIENQLHTLELFQKNILDEQANCRSNNIEALKKLEEQIQKSIDRNLSISSELKRIVQEFGWAITFADSIKNTWLASVNLSLGRWAIGYPFAYILFRTLEAQKPLDILELGLGESSKIILAYKNYACNEGGGNHTIVEQSKAWIKFFKKNNEKLLGNTELVQLDYEFSKFRSFENVRVFRNFKEKFINKKFDLICIDAPIGGDMKDICRVDILSILPNCLNSSFVILLDDYNRQTEKNLAKILLEELDKNNISYITGCYEGEKSTLLIASPNLTYLSSL